MDTSRYFTSQTGNQKLIWGVVGLLAFLVVFNVFTLSSLSNLLLLKDVLMSSLSPNTPSEAADKYSLGTGLWLSSSQQQNVDKTGCYSADSFSERIWKGSLDVGGAYKVLLPFCKTSVASTANQIGFVMRVFGRGSFSLTAISPSGEFFSAHKMDGNLANYEDWRRCFVPIPKSGNAFSPIESGTWVVQVNNIGRQSADSLTVSVNVAKATQLWQRTSCPQMDWHF